MVAPTERPGRPRLLVVASTFPARPGDGTPGFVLDLARVQARSFDTMVVAPRVPAGADAETIDGFAVRRFGYFPRRFEDLAHGAITENLKARRRRWLQVPPFLLAETRAIRRAVREHRPDAVHVHWIVPQGAAALLAAPRLPTLVTAHGGDVYGVRGWAAARVKRAVLRRARAVTVMNSDMRGRVLDLGADAERVHVMPMGARVEAVRAGARGVARVPGRLLFAGRLVEKKGVGVLLDAVRALPRDVAWTLHVAGDGPLRRALEEAATGLSVRFLGQVDARALAREFGAAEIAVLPSVPAASGDQDGLPVVLLEAMSAGCAVVASDLPGINEAVVPGESGLLTPPGDAAALAGALGALLSDAALGARLAATARARADRFSVDAVGRRYAALLHQMLRPADGRAPAPPPGAG